MDDFKLIYNSRAADYHRMISAEDIDGNLLAAFQRLSALQGKRILDLGTGTGRIPLLLAGTPSRVVGFDLHAAMLHQNQIQRKLVEGSWSLVQGDMRLLPFPRACTDITIAGWAIGHMCGWYASSWKEQIGRVLREMQRVTLPGGHLFILETLGTGSLRPVPPAKGLADYYEWLENEWGFTRTVISTDYQFTSVEDAVHQTEFFFGPALSDRIREHQWTRLPEWTGLWTRRL